MVGANIHAICILPDKARQTFAHIRSTSFGECKAQNVAWQNSRVVLKDFADSDAKDLRFSSPWPCNNQERTLGCINRLFLFLVFAHQRVGSIKFISHSYLYCSTCQLLYLAFVIALL